MNRFFDYYSSFGASGGSGRGSGRGQGGRGQGGRNSGRGPGILGGGRGSGGQCVCSECGATVAHRPGTPCNEIQCPKCGAVMGRK